LKPVLGRVAAGRSAGGIGPEEIRWRKHRCLCRGRWFDQETEAGGWAGCGSRPLRGFQAATAIVVLTAALKGAERSVGRLRRLRHPVMTMHRRLRRVTEAVHRLRPGSTSQRHRRKGRDEHDKRKKASRPARSSPHLRKAYQYPVPSCQWARKAVAGCQSAPENHLPFALPVSHGLGTGNWVLGTDSCTISPCTNSARGCSRQSAGRS